MIFRPSSFASSHSSSRRFALEECLRSTSHDTCRIAMKFSAATEKVYAFHSAGPISHHSSFSISSGSSESTSSRVRRR